MLAKRTPADQKGLVTTVSTLIVWLLLAPSASAQQRPDFLFDRPSEQFHHGSRSTKPTAGSK